MTTNNKMELQAVIEGLRALQKPSIVELHSDSRYVLDGLEKWIKGWKRNGWRTASKAPVKNQEQWMLLDELREKHEVRFHWIKGHNEHPENERCDEMAVEASRQYMK